MSSPAELKAIRERLNTKDEAHYKHLYDAQALLALYDAQSELLKTYGQHKPSCDVNNDWEILDCSCGFQAALGSQP